MVNRVLLIIHGEQGIINYSLKTVPDIPIYDIDGNYATIVREGYTNPNPIAMAMMDQVLLNRQKLTGNIFFEVTPIKNLVWHAELGYDILVLPKVNAINLWWTLVVGSVTVTIVVFRRTAVHSGSSRTMLRIVA